MDLNSEHEQIASITLVVLAGFACVVLVLCVARAFVWMG